MIYDLLEYIFITTGMRWRIGPSLRLPSESNIKDALDEAASMLYPEDVGTSITVDTIGLHVTKTDTGFKVYALVGEYS